MRGVAHAGAGGFGMIGTTYDALTTRAQAARTAAAGASREGRYREAMALRDQADADLAEATR